MSGPTTLDIRWAFLVRLFYTLIINWMDPMDVRGVHLLLQTLVIHSAVVAHSLNIRLIRQEFAKKQIGRALERIWTLPNFEKKNIGIGKLYTL